MTNEDNIAMIPDEVITSKIYLIRNKKVMLDRDLAELYGVETRVLKQSVRRNVNRFPPDFMFEMSVDEFQNWRSQIVISNEDKMGLRYPPFCFTEHGVLMLSTVLNSEFAIEINIQIIRVFTRIRSILQSNNEIIAELEQMKSLLAEHDNNIVLIYEILEQLEEDKQQQIDQQNREKIGYKRYNE